MADQIRLRQIDFMAFVKYLVVLVIQLSTVGADVLKKSILIFPRKCKENQNSMIDRSSIWVQKNSQGFSV